MSNGRSLSHPILIIGEMTGRSMFLVFDLGALVVLTVVFGVLTWRTRR